MAESLRVYEVEVVSPDWYGSRKVLVGYGETDDEELDSMIYNYVDEVPTEGLSLSDCEVFRVNGLVAIANSSRREYEVI
jgi:hypothetical protein